MKKSAFFPFFKGVEKPILTIKELGAQRQIRFSNAVRILDRLGFPIFNRLEKSRGEEPFKVFSLFDLEFTSGFSI